MHRPIPFLLGCLFLSQTVAGSDETLETITVTASRTPVPLEDVGSSVTIISAEELANSQATHLAELLREVPGFAVSRQGTVGSVTQLRVRGAEANQLLVMIDGIEANDFAQGGGFNFAHMMIDHIERVEIVRGPQSALWGSDALAGVINIITRPTAGTDGVQTANRVSGFVEAGSFNTQKTGAAWRHRSDRTNVKLFVDHLDSDGTNISRTGSEDDGYRNTTAGIAGDFRATDNIRLSWSLRETDTESEFDAVDTLVTGLPTDAPFVTDTDQRYGALSLELDLLDGSLDQIFSLARTETENVNKTAAAVPDITRGTKNQLSYQTNWYFQAGGLNQIVSIVGEYEEVDYEQRGPVSFFGDPNKDLDTDTRSIAVEYRVNTSQLALSTSYRHDDNSEFKNADTWRITGSWDLPNDSTRLHASMGEASKNPTFTERFGFFDTFVGNPELEPEHSFSWETGIDHRFLDGRMNVAATWFKARLEDEINGFVFDPATGAFTARNRSDDSDREGIELVMNWQPVDPLKLNFSYTRLDATEHSSGNETEEIRRPENIASLQANYSWTDANLRLSVTHTGQQFDNYFPPFPPFQKRVELDSFTLVNLSAGYWLNDHVQLTARVENLLDENYEEVFGFQAPGIGAYGGVKVSF